MTLLNFHMLGALGKGERMEAESLGKWVIVTVPMRIYGNVDQTEPWRAKVA
jgi:hypothetical protein